MSWRILDRKTGRVERRGLSKPEARRLACVMSRDERDQLRLLGEAAMRSRFVAQEEPTGGGNGEAARPRSSPDSRGSTVTLGLFPSVDDGA